MLLIYAKVIEHYYDYPIKIYYYILEDISLQFTRICNYILCNQIILESIL